MWLYDKKTQYPIKITKPDPRMAIAILTQYGGPNGELAASLRYLSQRFSMPTKEAKATLNDIGTEELAHLEMIGTMVHQLMDKVPKELERLHVDTNLLFTAELFIHLILMVFPLPQPILNQWKTLSQTLMKTLQRSKKPVLHMNTC